MIENALYLFEVEKANPDKDFYVVKILDFSKSEIFCRSNEPIYCFLNKVHAIKAYTPGETGLATFTGKYASKYPILSQKIPAHIINILKLFIPEELRKEKDVFFDRAATTRRANFCKVIVWGNAGLLDFKELQTIFEPFLSDVLKHIPYPYFIPSGQKEVVFLYEPPPVNMVLNALLPAPIERIVDYFYEPHIRRITISVREADLPLFLWKDYQNVKIASKLLKIAYRFINVDTYTTIDIDPYNLIKEDEF